MTPQAPDFPDACPSLIHHPGDLPASHPFLLLGDSSRTLLARYRCPCGREWETQVDAEGAGWPVRTEAAT